MKRVAEASDPPVVIPVIVVAVDVHVALVVPAVKRGHSVWDAFITTIPRILLGLYRIRELYSPNIPYQVASFLKFLHTSLYPKP